jgi:hypothetical protein
MKYERIVLISHHGFDGTKMDLGKCLGSTTEYDQESAVCACLSSMLLDEKYRCEYVPKTKRQWEKPLKWRNDLLIEVKCSFLSGKDKLQGTYDSKIADAFPLYSWNGTGDLVLILGKVSSLQSASITAKDLFRNFTKLL